MANKKNVSRSRVKERAKQNQRINQQKKKVKPKKKKFKIKYKAIFLFIVIVLLLALLVKFIYNMPIQNIIVKDNYYLSDQEIIDIAEIRNYPSTLANPSYMIEKRLLENDFIESVKVEKKKFLSKVVITVDENRPLFYYQSTGKTVLEDGTMVDTDITVPTLINQVPDTVYEKLLKKMSGVPISVLDKMSEIKYVPTDVDAELFLIAMNDGNYVYVTLSKFERIYNYIEYAEGFDNNKGILHLDSGDYLEIIEED